MNVCVHMLSHGPRSPTIHPHCGHPRALRNNPRALQIHLRYPAIPQADQGWPSTGVCRIPHGKTLACSRVMTMCCMATWPMCERGSKGWPGQVQGWHIYEISHGMPWQDTDRDDRPALAMFRHDWTSLAVTGRGKRRVIVVNSS